MAVICRAKGQISHEYATISCRHGHCLYIRRASFPSYRMPPGLYPSWRQEHLLYSRSMYHFHYIEG
jgi:hypothetical protein